MRLILLLAPYLQKNCLEMHFRIKAKCFESHKEWLVIDVKLTLLGELIFFAKV